MEEEEEEGGIISESVSASSVIQMFGGVGKFKKTPSPSCVSSGERSAGGGDHVRSENIKNVDN